jgi:hypothetical protein
MTLGAFVLFLMHPDSGNRSLDDKVYAQGVGMSSGTDMDEAMSDEDDYVCAK